MERGHLVNKTVERGDLGARAIGFSAPHPPLESADFLGRLPWRSLQSPWEWEIEQEIDHLPPEPYLM